MKILFDPIYTNEVHRCASTVKFANLSKYLLDAGHFIYWMVPLHLSAEETDWLPKHERLLYIPVTTDKTRYHEYRRISEDHEKVFAYIGAYSDWDVCVTNRTGMVGAIRAWSIHHSSRRSQFKRIIVIEDFPQMTFKSMARCSPNPLQDAYTLSGYQQADLTLICAYWEKDIILSKAKDYLSYAEVARLRKTIVECHPKVLAPMMRLKTKAMVVAQHSQESPFTIVFAGRMLKGHGFDSIFSIMEKNWVLKEHARKINSVVCTQSMVTGRVDVPDFVDLRYYNRDQFWSFMETEASVGLFFSKEEDYSMSLIEPMLLGVPYAVYRAPWSEASLGKEYPFFFRTEMEAYTIVKAFHDDYAGNYLKFAQWHQTHFKSLIEKRDAITIPTEVLKVVEEYEQQLIQDAPLATEAGAVPNVLRSYLTEEPANFGAILQRAAKDIPFKTLLEKELVPDQYNTALVFANNRYLWRNQLIKAGAQPHLLLYTFTKGSSTPHYNVGPMTQISGDTPEYPED